LPFPLPLPAVVPVVVPVGQELAAVPAGQLLAAVLLELVVVVPLPLELVDPVVPPPVLLELVEPAVVPLELLPLVAVVLVAELVGPVVPLLVLDVVLALASPAPAVGMTSEPAVAVLPELLVVVVAVLGAVPADPAPLELSPEPAAAIPLPEPALSPLPDGGLVLPGAEPAADCDTSVKVWLRLPPSSPTAGTMASARSPAIRAYSIAAAPPSALSQSRRSRAGAPGLWRQSICMAADHADDG
jgi:hypothetical protein